MRTATDSTRRALREATGVERMSIGAYVLKWLERRLNWLVGDFEREKGDTTIASHGAIFAL
jgi:hypothetical protein